MYFSRKASSLVFLGMFLGMICFGAGGVSADPNQDGKKMRALQVVDYIGEKPPRKWFLAIC